MTDRKGRGNRRYIRPVIVNGSDIRVFFFFFQAEDGIRDLTVTGVQTCALPICGTAEGIILDRPRGSNGFGYDPLFYFPQIRKTFAELSAEQKAQFSHRGAAFRGFLEWYRNPTHQSERDSKL